MLYIEEHVQRTGVAIETQGFTFVTSGRKRESLTDPPKEERRGGADVEMSFESGTALPCAPRVRKLLACELPSEGLSSRDKINDRLLLPPVHLSSQRVVDYLGTEISTSQQKKFPLVTFVDTPGLVDGDMKYPFDVNQTLHWLGDLADLIFVFFDPIGQALCKRTLNIVEKLNEKHSERIRFYLSKADEAGHEADRQRVMMQIVQELCKRPGLNKQGFDMPTIYIPNPNKTVRCMNQIEEPCRDIEKTINQTIQNSLNAVERDCDTIAKVIDERLACDAQARSHNRRTLVKSFAFAFLSGFFPLMLVLTMVSHGVLKGLTQKTLGESALNTLQGYTSPVKKTWNIIPEDYRMIALTMILGLSLVLLFLRRWLRSLPTLSKKEKSHLAQTKDYVQSVVMAYKEKLYNEYLSQSVADHDLL
ncbi:unnamed protein product [Darwinula stevensoni]|uniref:Uncharacterized protein n=1 Tax=Darwinula stevensoni TaxID=69355 RepID=A0A7R8XJT9_9CRUS|nr:unnamed protein product [Darwinula stevensoni]CAG0895659.1 unnamed protein product [Darwinula stevensoni]